MPSEGSDAACVHDWKNIGPGGFEMPVVICSKCGASNAAAEPDTMRDEYDFSGSGERGKFYKP